MQTYKQFADKYKISLSHQERGSRNDGLMQDHNMRHYYCKLHYQGVEYPFWYSMGKGNTSTPNRDECLQSLAMDARGANDAGSFEEWARDLGYDEDSRKAERIYQTCKEIHSELSLLFGEKLLEELFECEEE